MRGRFAVYDEKFPVYTTTLQGKPPFSEIKDERYGRKGGRIDEYFMGQNEWIIKAYGKRWNAEEHPG